MLWLAYIVPVVVIFYRPVRRMNAVLAPLVFLSPFVVFSAVEASPIQILPSLFGVLTVMLLALHPVSQGLFRFDHMAPLNRYVAGVVLVVAVPILADTNDQTLQQLTADEEHELFAHFGVMAIASVYVILFGALAVLRDRDTGYERIPVSSGAGRADTTATLHERWLVRMSHRKTLCRGHASHGVRRMR